MVDTPHLLSPLPARSTTLAFVDAGIADSASLISQFQPDTEVHLLDSSQDAIDQITSILANRSNVSAIHIVSHGSDGSGSRRNRLPASDLSPRLPLQF